MPASPFASELDAGVDPLVALRLDLLAPDGTPLGQYGGTWDRERKAWSDEERGQRTVTLHAGQVPAARWFAAWRKTPRAARAIFTMFLWGGRAGGKTFLGIHLLLAYAVSHRDAICWVVNQTNLAGEECRREIEAAMPAEWYRREDCENGEIRYHLRNGTLIRMRSGARASTLKAGRVDCAFLNEGALLSKLAYDNVRPRVADKAGLVIVATNPAETERGRWVEAYKDGVDHGELAAVAFDMAVDDNPHISMAAVNARKAELSEEDWEAERFGKTHPIGTVALTSWRRGLNFADVPAHFVNCTLEVTKRIYSVAKPFVIGFDFQIHPYCVGVVEQYYRDPAEPSFVMSWITDFATGADEAEVVRELEDLGYDGDDCVCVPDASAAYQDAKHSRKGKGNPSRRILSNAGFRHIFNPVPGSDANPDVVARCRAFNALLRSADKRTRMYVARDLEPVAEALERLPRKHGRPDGRSEYSHIYDAAAYPAFRFYRTYVVNANDEGKQAA